MVRKRSWRDGGVAATRYERANPGVRKSTREEDIHMHIDYWHDDQGVDVKGNNLPDEIWVELKNVQGKHGWVFGEATSIAFDMPDLAAFVKQEVDFSVTVPKSEAYKKCYTRRDREDLITMLVLDDLQQFESYQMVGYCTTYIHPGTGKVCSVFS